MVEKYKCVKCGVDFKAEYDTEGYFSPTRCIKCDKEALDLEKKAINTLEKARKIEQQIRIKETKKKLAGKDPYEVLAHMKIMLERSKTHFRQSRGGWWISPHESESKESILQECYDILEAYDIPSKYLIAEALDSKEE